MDNFDMILKRADIQSIREYIINGAGDGDIDPRTYEERQLEAEQPMRDFLESHYPDEQERAEAFESIVLAISGNQDIFLEIGMITGARLCYQLLLGGEGKE